MSIKRTSSSLLQRTSNRYTVKDEKLIPRTPSDPQENAGLLKKSQKLIESSRQKRQVAPDKLKLMRQVFTTISNSQSMSIGRLTDALLALGHDSRKDIGYDEFLIEHEIKDTSIGLLDFEHFALLVLEYEEKLRLEEEALRRLDLKIAFECFDVKKDGMIDADELSTVMSILKLPITDREANEMIEFVDHDKDSLLSFDEFLTIFTQISAMNTI